MERFNSGKLRNIFRVNFPKFLLVWRSLESMFGSRRRSKKKISVLVWYFRNNSLPPSSSRTLRTKSHWSFVTGQCDNSVWIISNIFTTSDVRLIFILSSTMDWYLEVKVPARDRQYSFCLLIPKTKGIKMLKRLTWMYLVMHNTCTTHGRNIKTRKNCVDVNLAIRKGLTFYRTRSNAIILQGILPAYYISKVAKLKTGEVLHEKACMSPRPPPKISLRHDWARGDIPLSSTVDQQPEGEVARQSRGEVARQANSSNQPNQSQSQSVIDQGNLMTRKTW